MGNNMKKIKLDIVDVVPEHRVSLSLVEWIHGRCADFWGEEFAGHAGG